MGAVLSPETANALLSRCSFPTRGWRLLVAVLFAVTAALAVFGTLVLRGYAPHLRYSHSSRLALASLGTLQFCG